MLSRDRLAAFVVLVSGCFGVLAAGADAKPTPLPKPTRLHYRPLPMLAARSCGGLLGTGSFPGAAKEEVNASAKTDSGSSSICVFMPPEPTEAEQAAGERPIGGGSLTLSVYNRLTYEFRGKERDIASFVPFPPFTRKDPAKIGSHAYVGVSVQDVSEGADVAFGVAQTRNDLATVAIEFPSDAYPGGDPVEHVELLLRSVIADLCPSCHR
jgi:hypothetical protein